MAAMTALAIAGTVMQAAQMGSSFLGGKAQEKAAYRSAMLEGKWEAEITRERLRKLAIEERTQAGETRARAVGSGVKSTSSSPLLNLAEQAREYGYERDLTKRVGATKAANAYQRGKDVGRVARYSSYADVAQGASNIFSIMHGSGMFSSGEKG